MNQYDDEIEAARSGWGAPLPITVNSLTADAVLFGPESRLCGWSLRAVTAGGAVVARIRSGGTAAGQVLGVIALAAGASETITLNEGGLRAEGGLFIEVDSGTLEGVVYARFPQ